MSSFLTPTGSSKGPPNHPSFDNLLAGFMELGTAVKLMAAVYYREGHKLKSREGVHGQNGNILELELQLSSPHGVMGSVTFPVWMYHQSTDNCQPGMLT